MQGLKFVLFLPKGGRPQFLEVEKPSPSHFTSATLSSPCIPHLESECFFARFCLGACMMTDWEAFQLVFNTNTPAVKSILLMISIIAKKIFPALPWRDGKQQILTRYTIAIHHNKPLQLLYCFQEFQYLSLPQAPKIFFTRTEFTRNLV